MEFVPFYLIQPEASFNFFPFTESHRDDSREKKMKIRCKITCIDSNYNRSKQKFIEKTSQNCLFYLISLVFLFFSLFFRFYSFSFIISKSLITFNVRWSFVLVDRLRSRQWANMEKKDEEIDNMITSSLCCSMLSIYIWRCI